jgi:hypothetical protein
MTSQSVDDLFTSELPTDPNSFSVIALSSDGIDNSEMTIQVDPFVHESKPLDDQNVGIQARANDLDAAGGGSFVDTKHGMKIHS